MSMNNEKSFQGWRLMFYPFIISEKYKWPLQAWHFVVHLRGAIVGMFWDVIYQLNFSQKKQVFWEMPVHISQLSSRQVAGPWGPGPGIIWPWWLQLASRQLCHTHLLAFRVNVQHVHVERVRWSAWARGVRGYVPGCLGPWRTHCTVTPSQPATQPVCLSVCHPQLETRCSWHLLYFSFCESGQLGFNSTIVRVSAWVLRHQSRSRWVPACQLGLLLKLYPWCSMSMHAFPKF